VHPFFEEIDVIVSRNWRFFSRFSDWNLGSAARDLKINQEGSDQRQ
jgi:hypothetical protein